MKNIDLSKTLSDRKRGWIALSKDQTKVIFSAKNFNNLMNKVEKAGKVNSVVLMPALENYRGFIGVS